MNNYRKIAAPIILVILFFISLDSFATPLDIFMENQKSIAVVTTYNKKGEPLTEGTGFIVNAEGAVITNYHVISIAKDIKIKADGRVLDVEGVTFTDRENDVVILKVKGRGMPAVRTGEAEKLTPGEKLFIMSKPDDSGKSIHEGVFRKIRTTSLGNRFIEISAPVAHGSSGSPVFNARGEVVGIVTFRLQRTDKIILAMPLNSIRDKIESTKIIMSKERLIKGWQESAEYLFYLGYFLVETGAYKDAIDVFKESIRLRPDYPEAYYNLGAAYEKTGRNKDAVQAYKKAIRSKTNFADAQFNLGAIYAELGMYKEALEVLKQAVMLEPDYAEAHYNIGLVHLRLKDRPSALERYKVLKTINNNLAGKLLRVIHG